MSDTQQNVKAEMDHFFGHLRELQDRINDSVREQNLHTIEVLGLCSEHERANLLITLNSRTLDTVDGMFLTLKEVALAAIDKQ